LDLIGKQNRIPTYALLYVIVGHCMNGSLQETLYVFCSVFHSTFLEGSACVGILFANSYGISKGFTTHKLKLFITFISLMKMEWFKASHVYINLENQFQIFNFSKIYLKKFFELPGMPEDQRKSHIMQ